MLADLIILALIIAFVGVATLGHILLGVALLAGRGARRTSDASTSARAAVVMPPNATNEFEPARRKLAA